jgi:L-alanine-DL-glutamate epimerase-like enolase superfamily enzyme
MRIVALRETTVSLAAPIANANLRFDAMTASALALITDARVDGRPLVGFAFDSIGRYAHGALLRERIIPRVLAADPAEYCDERSGALDPAKLWTVAMRNEKPGGHGERAGAVGLLDAAAWDAVAKFERRPLWSVLAERFGGDRSGAPVEVYASGGHYRDGADESAALRDELARYQALGYRRFKIKIGAGLDRDLPRVEAALGVAGNGGALAVDGNGSFPLDEALRYARALEPLGLAWFEEPLDPLDYEAHRTLAQRTPLPLATGENIFSAADTRNLLLYGGLRADRDFLQIDISLSYGIVEYLRLIALCERQGWSRKRLLPHAGHLLSFHVVAGLGLAAHEAAPDSGSLFGGYPEGVRVEDGRVRPWHLPGVGFEAKPNLFAVLAPLAIQSHRES